MLCLQQTEVLRAKKNTNFWDPEVFPADHKGAGEITQGKNLVDAAKAEGVKFFIWRCGTLP